MGVYAFYYYSYKEVFSLLLVVLLHFAYCFQLFVRVVQHTKFSVRRSKFFSMHRLLVVYVYLKQCFMYWFSVYASIIIYFASKLVLTTVTKISYGRKDLPCSNSDLIYLKYPKQVSCQEEDSSLQNLDYFVRKLGNDNSDQLFQSCILM
eukprot:TRINITY_DN54115_c0_g1_i1.p2 TRINITY_DN54115_c0_g1~~TRINITY_DN54115_c0_g1_i1.p2  ORF type:complete len:149 (+),score=3.48 TRINITY_DN54115_c0_g1_i1:58-504(+)